MPHAQPEKEVCCSPGHFHNEPPLVFRIKHRDALRWTHVSVKTNFLTRSHGSKSDVADLLQSLFRRHSNRARAELTGSYSPEPDVVATAGHHSCVVAWRNSYPGNLNKQDLKRVIVCLGVGGQALSRAAKNHKCSLLRTKTALKNSMIENAPVKAK